mgnify:CR=1 FL=1
MNEKFYALPEEKQSQILNAAYKVFATNQYKKAPTSEIAAEAGISKSLLFYYFHHVHIGAENYGFAEIALQYGRIEAH